MNIIEALQKNKEPFGIMSTDEFTNEEMKAKAKEIGPEKFSRFYGDGFGNNNGHFDGGFVYRLRPDYEEEPEIVEYKVKEEKGELRHQLPRKPYGSAIDVAIRRPDFIGFRTGDWLTGRTYENKLSKGLESTILFDELYQYNVLVPDSVVFEVKP